MYIFVLVLLHEVPDEVHVLCDGLGIDAEVLYVAEELRPCGIDVLRREAFLGVVSDVGYVLE